MSADLRAGIEALCDDPFRGYGVDVVRVSDLRALLAAHPVQNEVTFETNLLDPVWLTTSSSRCTTRPGVHPVQVTTGERREALASLLGDLFEGAVLWADVDAILAALGIVVSDRPEETT